MAMSKNETFIIEVHETENATWQGEIIWANEKRRQYFRSALELLRLMDSVLTDDADRESLKDAFLQSEDMAS